MITAHIATMDGREKSLAETVESLSPQVDAIFISRDTNGKGDLNKLPLILNRNPNHIVLMCDDDLIYPDNYVDVVKKKIAQYGGVVTFHGRTFSKGKLKSYYKDKADVLLKCLERVDQDKEIEVGGTGVMAFKAEVFCKKEVVFTFPDDWHPNMLDIQFSGLCKQMGIPITCVAHKKGWIRYSDKFDRTDTIFDRYKNHDKLQTETYNRIYGYI